MRAQCGNEKKSDALISVDLSADRMSIDVISKVEKLFGKHIRAAVNEALKEMNVESAEVVAQDFGALDFVIKARVKTAVKRARRMEGE